MAASLLLVESVLGEDRSSKVRRRIKRLMKKLGPLRDVQVQIQLVKKWDPSESTQRFEDSLQGIERQERNRVRDYLSQNRKKSILQELRDFQKDAAKRQKEISPATLQAGIRSALSVQRKDLKAARIAMAPSDPKSLHAVRRTARKLRYCLEAAGEIVGTPPKSELGRLRRYQTQLGNKRDLQLLQAKFSGMAAERRVSALPSWPGGVSPALRKIARQRPYDRRRGGGSSSKKAFFEVEPPPRPLHQRKLRNICLDVAATPTGRACC